MITERKAAKALAGKTARPCDGCSRKRARWFCASDDAFLCQACDESVHSANQLASRHERVRLETASSMTSGSINSVDSPPWLQGFTKKARTPRHNNKKSLLAHQQLKDEEKILMNSLPLVPEIDSEEEGNTVVDDDEDQLLYRVPVFDHFAAELCTDDMIACEGNEIAMGNEEGNMVFDGCGQEGTTCDLDNLPAFVPSDMDLTEFAADVKNLLGRGLEDNSPDIKDFGLLDYKEEDDDKFCFEDKVVKVKDEQELEAFTDCHFDQAFDIAREPFDWNFNYESPITGDEEEEEKAVPSVTDTTMMNSGNTKEMGRNVSLRLDYEAVITAWASHGSPWTTGSRPELNPDDCWPHYMGTCPNAHHHPYGVLEDTQEVAMEEEKQEY
ncbi:hypothetical protein GH714_018011 [Hevea brasiliensis]|uniref:B box-type domain-containing protein n=2 Tax=Hevea brasiliensis TaxID=3981 RepID=A0A6A6NI68_HEVBR|nr:hypothetical protein GH714_018011 [Hevea brasiliensis]